VDHTPFSDYARLKSVAVSRPDLLRNQTGEEMFKVYDSPEEQPPGKYLPIIQGSGHRAKVLSTIGVTRGFGDFTTSKFQGFYIKPFLSPEPDVTIMDLEMLMETRKATTVILVLGCDGIWDGLLATAEEPDQNERAREIVSENMRRAMDSCELQHLCNCAAQAFVLAAKRGSKDDLTALVVALHTIVGKPPEYPVPDPEQMSKLVESWAVKNESKMHAQSAELGEVHQPEEAYHEAITASNGVEVNSEDVQSIPASTAPQAVTTAPVFGRDSWQAVSGRTGGREGYQPGDFTKGLINAARGLGRHRSWTQVKK